MRKLVLLLVVLLSANVASKAQMTARVVRDSLFIPWEILYGPDDHIWFTQKNGYICRMEPVSGKIDTLYRETATVIQAEGGMLGLALHPSFSTTPQVFVAYNYMNGSTYSERIVKYIYDATTKTLSSPAILLDNIGAANFHNGCRLKIDGNYLYATTGDATVTSKAQDVNSLNGKILRLNLDGTIPSDNPIGGNPAWSWGHRNPQGIVFANGKLYQTEHGPNNDDEVNIIQKGRNYGWPNVEGYCDKSAETAFCTDSNVVEPLRAWTPTIAVCGVDYYDHPMFPSLQRSLIMTTLKDTKLYQLKLNGMLDSIATASVISQVSAGRLRGVCISPQGRIYISTSNSNAAGTAARVDKIIELYDPGFNNVTQPSANNFLKIYPNPAANTVTVMVAQNINNEMHYSITDMAGRAVAAGTLEHSGITLNTTQWPAGIYAVKVTNGTSTVTMQKLVKQ